MEVKTTLIRKITMINGYDTFVEVSSLEKTNESEETLMMNGSPFLTVDDEVYTYE